MTAYASACGLGFLSERNCLLDAWLFAKGRWRSAQKNPYLPVSMPLPSQPQPHYQPLEYPDTSSWREVMQLTTQLISTHMLADVVYAKAFTQIEQKRYSRHIVCCILGQVMALQRCKADYALRSHNQETRVPESRGFHMTSLSSPLHMDPQSKDRVDLVVTLLKCFESKNEVGSCCSRIEAACAI